MTRVLIMAGGSGGHVFPALAVAAELRARGADVFWLGTSRGLEAKLVPNAGNAMEWVSDAGLRGEIADLSAPAQRCAARSGPINLLVLGGSLGARALNEMVPAAVATMSTRLVEVAAAGLVPYPHAVDDHQTHNAQYLVAAGAAVVVQQRDLTPAKLSELLVPFCSEGARTRLLAMAEAARRLAQTRAAALVAEQCLEVAHG